jgi:hypothetical protein
MSCVALETQATQKHDQTVGPSSYSGSTYIAWQSPAIQLDFYFLRILVIYAETLDY